MKTQVGWAIIKRDKILINTVCDTRRGAIVNYFNRNGVVLVTVLMTDDEIGALWANKSKPDELCIRVNVSEQTTFELRSRKRKKK